MILARLTSLNSLNSPIGKRKERWNIRATTHSLSFSNQSQKVTYLNAAMRGHGERGKGLLLMGFMGGCGRC